MPSKRHLQLSQEIEILAIADEMAAAVTCLNPQNYETFLSSRQRLQTRLHEVLTPKD